MISGETSVYGILGHPVAHTLSPAMHNAAFRHLGINAVYVPFAVQNLAQAVQGLRGLNIRGASITVPFKEEIISLLDEVDLQARVIGAVNTVINHDGRLWGTNTDWQGALAALEEHTEVAGRHVLVLGAGGAGRAIVFALRQAGAQVTLVDLEENKARSLALEFGAVCVTLDKAVLSPAEILINATPVGMAPQDKVIPLPPDNLKQFEIVMDIVYEPRQTRLLTEAAARGCRGINGLQMLVHQGARQFELFTGHPAPLEIMRQAALFD